MFCELRGWIIWQRPFTSHVQVTTVCCLAVNVRAAEDRSFHVQVAVVPAAALEDDLKKDGSALNFGGGSNWIKRKGKMEKCKEENGMEMAFSHFLDIKPQYIMAIS